MIVVHSPSMDVLPFPPRPSAESAIRCGMRIAAGVAVHVWQDIAKPGDLCLCGRRILPAKASLTEQDTALLEQHSR